MRFQIIDAEQRSSEWFAARAGRATGSRAADILGKLKSGKESAARRDYRMQLVAERLTGTPQDDGYVNSAMQRGIELEQLARAAYEARTGNIVRTTGFLAMPNHMVGCSLDGDIDDFQGIIEIKVPKTATHLGYIRANQAPTEYLPQITHNLWVSGAAYCDFVSFDDRLPEHLQFFCIRVERDSKALEEYEAELDRFLSEVDAEYKEISKMRVAA